MKAGAVLPTDSIPIVFVLDGKLTGRMMRWGLVPTTGKA
jgi:putative SOS response-associated peptidase YedK